MDIEFTVPTIFTTPSVPGPPILPLARPKKRFLRNMQLIDESGRALTWFTRDENSLVSTMMMVLAALEVLRADLPESIAFDFADVAGLRWHDEDYPDEGQRSERCRAALARFRAADHADHAEAATSRVASSQVGRMTARGAEHARARLWRDPVMRSNILQIAENFVLLVPYPAEVGTRRKVTFSYELELPSDAGQSETIRSAAGQRRKILRFARGVVLGESIDHFVNLPTRGLFAAASYHAEVLAPEDLMVVGARLQLATDERRGANIMPRWVELASDGGTPLVHLYANGRRPVQSDPDDAPSLEFAQAGVVRVRLRVRAGLVMPVLLTAVAVAATLIGGIVARAYGYHPESATLAAVLVALPALYAAYLLPQGHPLMRRLFLAFRSVLVILAFLPLAAAATLAVDIGHSFRYVLWILFGAIALGCLIASATAFVRSFRINFDRTRA